jgi:hypothetical protein
VHGAGSRRWRNGPASRTSFASALTSLWPFSDGPGATGIHRGPQIGLSGASSTPMLGPYAATSEAGGTLCAPPVYSRPIHAQSGFGGMARSLAPLWPGPSAAVDRREKRSGFVVLGIGRARQPSTTTLGAGQRPSPPQALSSRSKARNGTCATRAPSGPLPEMLLAQCARRFVIIRSTIYNSLCDWPNSSL